MQVWTLAQPEGAHHSEQPSSPHSVSVGGWRGRTRAIVGDMNTLWGPLAHQGGSPLLVVCHSCCPDAPPPDTLQSVAAGAPHLLFPSHSFSQTQLASSASQPWCMWSSTPTTLYPLKGGAALVPRSPTCRGWWP